jgi:hypothetical protein
LSQHPGEAIPCLHIPPVIIELFALGNGKRGGLLASELAHSKKDWEHEQS